MRPHTLVRALALEAAAIRAQRARRRADLIAAEGADFGAFVADLFDAVDDRADAMYEESLRTGAVTFRLPR